MAKRTRGLYSALSSSRIYSAVQTLLAGRQSGRFLLEEHYRLPEYGIVLDVGCGPGVLVESVGPECRYFGFDPNADDIAKMRRLWARYFCLRNNVRVFAAAW